MRLSLKTINDELERLGSGAVLTKGDGYFYFQGGEAANWLDRSVRVPTLQSLTLEQWIGQYRELKAKNDALVKGNIASKDSATHLAKPAASNPEGNRPPAPKPDVAQRAAGKRSGGGVPQEQKAKRRPEPYLRLHHVPIFVRDQDRSLRFYLEQLGFSLVIDYNYGERGRFVLVAPPDGAAVLALIAPKPDSAEYKLIGRSGQAVFVTEDVTAKFQTWRKRGVRFHHSPQTVTWGGIFTSFEDVDGNSFILAGWDDLTRKIEARRRTIAQKAEFERRAAQELEIAKQVQARLFPQTAPHLRTFDYSGVCVQAREVGGDYYDFLNLGPQRLGLVIGDISGKGIAAALLMANLQANLRSQCAMASDEPERFLRFVNRLFYDNTTDNAFATLFFAEYNDHTRRLRYANCGHLRPLVFRHNGALERLDSTATILGIFKEWDCSTRECQLFSGDTLVLYTDGVTESFNDAGEDFGEQRLIRALETHRQLPPDALVASIVDQVKQFSPREQHDDITLIVGKCRGD
ncbi:MAG TPA: SpoIIE family protein phosphatase [Terriglobales bacterium]|nr:SpoIIE family protein phosphatase [Terriglobales bacterium]